MSAGLKEGQQLGAGMFYRSPVQPIPRGETKNSLIVFLVLSISETMRVKPKIAKIMEIFGQVVDGIDEL